jgi:molybdate transport system substrate-binding protein
MRFTFFWLCLYLLIVSPSSYGHAGIIYVAASSSMEGPIVSICQKFGQLTGYQCKITTAPSGHLYAHIMHGMAYDVFFSSDETYTQGLVNANKASAKNRFVVALGRVVLWSADTTLTADSLQQALLDKQNIVIAIANPGASPYGGATKEILQSYNLWNNIQGRLIYGKNIKQTYEFVINKRAPVGFVSLAQLPPVVRMQKRYWEPDPRRYKPVLHEVITLHQSRHHDETAAFLAYLRSSESCQIFHDAGFSCAFASQKA